jgi:TetR/AcrR family transcriptional regulator, transcriptional repressor for nem operon
MARPREFDEDDVLERAMQVFWRRGYQATSLGDLLEAMHLSKSSFYETFGTKRDLLLTALRRYAGSGMSGVIAPLLRKDASRPEIEETLRKMVRHARSAEGRRGCLINSTLAEVAPHDEVVFAATREALAQLESILTAAVARGQGKGEITTKEDARAIARFLANAIGGLNLAAKARPDRATLDDVVRVTLRALD